MIVANLWRLASMTRQETGNGRYDRDIGNTHIAVYYSATLPLPTFKFYQNLLI